MRRTASIEALLGKARQTLDQVKLDYAASIADHSVRDDLKADIKSLLGDLRSVLDYLAHEVFEACCSGLPKPDKLYFPIARSAAAFDQMVRNPARGFPDLEARHRPVWTVLESVQPYNDPWLGQFNDLNNFNKHEDLSPQTRASETRYHATAGTAPPRPARGVGVYVGPEGVSVLQSPNVCGGTISIGGRVVMKDGKPYGPPSADGLRRELIEWVDFKFVANGMSVLPFLEEAIRRIEATYQRLSAALRVHA